MDECPCCGRPMPTPLGAHRVITDARELLSILRRDGRPGQKREVYRSQDNTWHYTYSGSDRHIIDRRLITELVASGDISRVYNNSGDAYWIGATIDMDATLAERRRTGNRTLLVYVH